MFVDLFINGFDCFFLCVRCLSVYHLSYSGAAMVGDYGDTLLLRKPGFGFAVSHSGHFIISVIT